MNRRTFTPRLIAVAFWATTVAGAARGAEVSSGDAALGIRAALERGASAATATLGRPGGFLDNPEVRIPLPGSLDQAAKLARYTGQQAKVDELTVAMNRAAEAAVPEARALLVNAVKTMSVDDGRRILTGGDDAATQFFIRKTREPLGIKFRPIVANATRKVALADKYNALAGKAASVGLVRGDDANIDSYVTRKALDGLFLMIAEEERKIRQDPVGTGSAILAKVFGSRR